MGVLERGIWERTIVVSQLAKGGKNNSKSGSFYDQSLETIAIEHLRLNVSNVMNNDGRVVLMERMQWLNRKNF